MKRIQTNEYKNPSRIIGIQFSMLSPEEIQRNSVVEVVSRETMVNNKLMVGGLFDSKMGVLEQGLYCPTDGLTYIDSPGYFGHIELAKPVFFIQYIKDIMKVCKCVCNKCGKLLINKNQYKHVMEWSPEDRWEFINQPSMTIKRCGEKTDDGCGYKQPTKIKMEGFATLCASWANIEVDGKPMTKRLTPERLYKLFKRISDEDVLFMGLSPIWSRPEWMICKVLPIAPPAVRPSVKHDAQQRSEDDLTHIYMNILKNNNILKDKIRENASPNVIFKHYQIVQYFVAMIANNKASGTSPIAQTSGRPLQCISGRLNTKNGRIRGNLMGKRVDFSARSVITGDPNLPITALGIPLKIAMNITRPVTVNNRNRAFLMKLVQNGPDVYPGAKTIERKNGDPISLRTIDRMSIRLENGDVVHRHIMNGDAVLFNRQPSLHKMSMMCHHAVIMHSGNTFRFNVAVTNPYNADFDGDEMNMHMPQSISAETELMCLPAVTYQIISPSKNSPIIGIFQDSLLGCFQFTRDTVKMDALQAMKLLMMFPNVDVSKLTDKKTFTSFDILSQIMPPLSLKQKSKLYSEPENDKTTNNIIEIKNGIYLRGQMEKSILGATTKGILHRICNDFGNPTCVKFINDLQNVITEYMKTSSFSVGISDLIADQETKKKIVHVVQKQKQEVINVINKIHLGIFENNSAYSNAVEFENQVNNLLGEARVETEKIAHKSLSKSNRFLKIVNSGSKGSLINISQMISCLGPQSIEGKRAPYGFDNRTLPHFTKYDDSPTARGFIESSYITGLSAHEMFFHAMAGRIGLIDTAVKTSQTGYAQRRIVKSMEDILVCYDGTVRNHMGKIVQFQYGEDGFDSCKVENQNIPLVGMSVEDIYMRYDLLQDNATKDIFTKETKTRMGKQKAELREKCQKYIERMIEFRTELVENVFLGKNDNQIRLPVSFPNIIANIQGQLELNANMTVDITPLETFKLIEEYYEKMLNYMKPNELFRVLYEYYLCPKELLLYKRFSKKSLVVLLEMILLKYKEAIVHPGEMVGIIAAQSVGEPTTQLTLNTFHNTGVASKSNVTRGVPRIEEILRLTKNPKSNSLTIFLNEFDQLEQDRASKYANMIEYTRLNDIVKKVQIYFDPDDSHSVIEEDRALLQEYYEYQRLLQEVTESENKNENEKTSLEKWILRMEFDVDLMLDKNITMDDIHFAIVNSYKDRVSCIYSDYNSDQLIFRIRLLSSSGPSKKIKGVPEALDISDDIYQLKTMQDLLLKKIVLRGIDGISKVIPRKLQNMVVKEDGKYITKDIWILDTTGSNLLEILGLGYIDYKKTYSNDIYEVFETLGIESARQVILNELTEVMDAAGVYINYHHLSILADRMTYAKDMVAVYRSGLLNDDIGVIAKASFETHTEMLLNGAKHGLLDNLKGVSANVMTGQPFLGGTNSFQIHIDLKKMEEWNTQSEISMEKTSSVMEELEAQFSQALHISKETRMDECSQEKIVIQNYLSGMTVNDSKPCLQDNYDVGF
jgi:DNA-directed RNA polymerase II subunit RPB1